MRALKNNSMKNFELTSHCYDDTFHFGFAFGEKCKGGEVFLLSGELGSGKTVFTKGFAKGLGLNELIISPTFSIVNEYSGHLKLFHFDLYRLASCDELFDIGFDDYRSDESVCVLEWGDKCRDDIEPPVIRIQFSHLSMNLRKIEVFS